MRNNILNRFQLKHKLLTIGIATILFFLATLVLFMRYSYEVNKQKDLLTSFKGFHYNILELNKYKTGFLLNGQNETTFIESGKSEYITDFNLSIANSLMDIDSIIVNKGLSEAFTPSIDVIKNTITNSKLEMQKMTQLIRLRGDHKSGVLGTMIESSSKFSNRLKNYYNDATISENFNNLRIFEAQYIQKREMANRDKLKEELAIFENNMLSLTENFDTLETNTSILKLKNDFYQYKENIERLFNTDYEIGFLKNDNSIIFNLEQSINKADQEIATLILSIENMHHKERNKHLILLFSVSSIFLILIVFILSHLNNELLKPLINIKNYLYKLSKGELPDKIIKNRQDEVGEMIYGLNELTDNLKKTKDFSIAVGKGQYDANIEVFDNHGDLGSALLEMREELLKVSKERDEKITEDQQRNWTNSGLSLFNEILRQYTKDVYELSYKIISELVKYLNANQGALFSYNDDKPDDIYLELYSSYAYSKKKHLNKKIKLGEDLAGTCAIERKTIHLDDIPDDYIEIRSGLGGASPTNLLIVPLNLDNNLLGIIELASFNKFEPFEISFVEKLGEAVASSLSSVKMTHNTTELLKRTQIQADELSAKEEQMRKNMNQLRSTQEASAKKEAEARGFVSAVNHTIIRADYKTDGLLDYANSKFLNLMGYTLQQLKGRPAASILSPDEVEAFRINWQKLIQGGRHIEKEMRFKSTDGLRWLLATYTAIRNEHNNITKILFLAINIHEQKSVNLDYEGELKAISHTVIKSIYNTEGTIQQANSNFSDNLEYEWFEIKDKNILFFIPDNERDRFKTIWQSIAEGKPYETEQQIKTKQGTTKWYRGAYTPVKDFEGTVYKIVHIAYDISQQKQVEKEARNKAALLLKQDDEKKEAMVHLQKIQKQLSLKDQEMSDQIKLLNQENENQLKEIQEKEALMRSQIDAISKTNALVEYDIDGKILSVNDLLCHLLSYDKEELIGKNQKILFSTSFKRSFEYRELWPKVMGGLVVEGEFIRATKNGADVYTKGVFHPMKDAKNKVYKIMELSLDLTESKMQEAELIGQLEAINRANAMAEYKLDGNIINANTIFCKLFDYEENNLLGRNHRIFVVPGQRKSDNYKEFWAELREGIPQEGEYERINSNGEAIYVKSIFNPMINNKGEVYKIIELTYNITTNKLLEFDLKKQTSQLIQQEEMLAMNIEEMKSTQDEMDRKDAKMNSLLDSIDNSTYSIEYSTNGQILTVSKVVEQLTGLKKSELIDMHNTDLIDFTEMSRTEYNDMWMKVKYGKIVQITLKKRINNRDFWFKDTYSPIYNDERKVEKILNIAFDITQIKKLEKQLKESNNAIIEKESTLRENYDKIKIAQDELILKETNLRNMLDAINTSTLVFEYDIEGFLQNTNKDTLKALDIDQGEVKKIHYKDIHSEDDFDTLWELLKRGSNKKKESVIKHNNETRWVVEAFSPIVGKENTIERIISIAVDITETHKQKEELEAKTKALLIQENKLRQNLDKLEQTQKEKLKNEAEMKSQFDAMNRAGMLVEIDVECKISRVNDTFCQITGYEEDVVIGKPYRIMFGSVQKAVERWMEQWDSLLNGNSIEGTFKFFHKNESPLYIKGAFNPMINSRGEVYKVVLMGYDLTWNKLQENLLKSQVRAIETHNSIVYYSIPEIEILSVNRLFCNISGFRRHEAIGLSHNDILDESMLQDDSIELMWEQLKNGKSQTAILKYKGKGDKTFMVRSVFAPIKARDEKLTKVMEIASEVFVENS